MTAWTHGVRRLVWGAALAAGAPAAGAQPRAARPAAAPAPPREAYVDAAGVLRWRGTNAELALFGANYTLPSASDYRAAGALGLDRKRLVDADMAAFAAAFPLAHEPGSAEAYTYSSGTSNIVAAAAQRIIGGGEAGMRAFLAEELFGPTGMASAEPGFDDAGTFVASSFLHATARDYARFGLLYLRDGMWDGRRLLPEGWVDAAREPVSADEEVFHGAHWWARADERGTFFADGFEGQRILCVPATDVIVVRVGRTHTSLMPALDRLLLRLADAAA